MLLYKIEDFNPNYRQEAFDGDDIKGLNVYAGNTNDKIGTIDTLLVDETGRFRYFVLDTGAWIFGKKVLLPIALCRLDFNARRV
ncbi:PRC-barrel domain-containing protein AvaK [Microseira wollei NIES-4236]|uniref:PRC-barrel domain-containing protein AvaK n=1 Tax=Microseira wollei NIES-4236 TaxID=2530354 RepID=A0AAV3XL98_9CYAN|nr:PRC-barrel domain-containing protein [Microseira wollei]GET41561.1 PRC-barrel domain-containing protein AvaK [Microseira wollei NIES-4236]